MEQTYQQISNLVGQYVVQLLGPLMILVIGWLAALIIRAIVQEVLHRTAIDNKLARFAFGEEGEQGVQVEKVIARAVYYLVLAFVLVAFFQTLGLTAINEPLNRFLGEVFEFAPRIFSAVILIGIAWLLATVLRRVVRRVLTAMNMDERLGAQAELEDEERPPLTKTVSDAVYWIVLVLFFPAVLNALSLEALFRPMEAMVTQLFEFLPNLLAAGVIFVAGWFAARIGQRIGSNLAASAGLDRLGKQTGLDRALGALKPSRILGFVIYGLVLIPVLVASLNALQLDAITRPASNMLGTILESIPAIFAAVLLVVIVFFVGRLLSDFVANLLNASGFDGILAKIGFTTAPRTGKWAPSSIVGTLVMIGTLLLASIEALRLLSFTAVAEMVGQFTIFSGQVLLGLAVFAAALYLSSIASRAVMSTGTDQAVVLALAARISVLVLGGAIALRQMGLAGEIIDLAFGLLLGAVTIAIALAFGLGGRDVAKRELEEWVDRVKRRRQEAG